jgi:Tfp pilus assembly protein PilX
MISLNSSGRLGPSRGVVLICVLVCLLVATTLIVLSAASALRARREALAYHQRVQLEQLLGSAVKRAQLAIAEQDASYAGERWFFGEQNMATPGFESAELNITILSQDESRLRVRVSAAFFANSAETTDQSQASLNPPIQRRTIELSLPAHGSNTSQD